MIAYPHIDPEIVRIGPLALRWYGLMYLLGFGASYLLVGKRISGSGGRVGGTAVPAEFLSSFYTWLILGLVIGARLGYVLFYDLMEYLRHPAEIFAVWHGGMSFHGGLIGAVAAGILCCRRFGVDPWRMADLVTATAPIGLGLGRLGNFINGELFGRVTDVPWAMVFPAGGPLPRHPSQLYEFLLEGVALFSLLWFLRDRMGRPGRSTALFLVLYGSFRIFVEFFRQPDPQLGFIAGPFTMGQLLSTAMIAAGVVLFVLRRNRRANRPV
ncbi:MAG: prolipoprotein diacylglyceryl transferase [Nitrospiraceae bacterium]|nr:prolipoprotein diacylglyceryl transferase [Nitrospiraceae bacterium]